MDIYSTSFSFPRRSLPAIHTDVHSAAGDLHYAFDIAHSSLPNQLVSPRDSAFSMGDIPAETVQKVVFDATQAQSCHITYTRSESGLGWNFHISGSYLQVMAARGMIMREAPIQVRSTIKVLRNDILDNPATTPTLKPDVRLRLDEIAEQAHTNISVINPPALAGNGSSLTSQDRFGLETEKMCELLLVGTSDCVEVARVRLLVMLDELSGLHSECCEIDHKLHAVIAGRKRSALQSIQEDTSTNIYYPSPLHGAFGSSTAPIPMAAPLVPGIAPPRQNNNVLWITGEPFGVQRARDMLFQVSMHKVRSKTVMSREVAIVSRKIDWMLTDRNEELKAIMNDNGTFISFPPLGSQSSLVTIFGDNRVNIQRTVRCIMQLACQFYVASFWLLPAHFNTLMSSNTVNLSQTPGILKRLSAHSGAEIVFKSNCFEVHGLAHEVRKAIQLISELDLVRGFHHEIRFQLELANDQREFISGKKNGKINKIMQAANVKIKFETFNDHNFLIEMSGNDLGILTGLSMLHEELPAEISFHIPESYHKRIIGVGGKSIQRIMKKYGVYVKFSSAEELAAVGGYTDIEDNVVARTPAKNAVNLESLKQAVMELVGPKDKDFVLETLFVPRRFHRVLLGEKSIFIRDIETKTNARIRFPDKETGSDIVTIFGPESQMHITAAMLLDHIPFEVQMPIPFSPDLSRFCASADFSSFVEKIKHEFQVSILPAITNSPVGSPASHKDNSWHECSFRLGCQRSNSDSLSTVREMLEQLLVEHNIRVYPPPHAHKRADSFAEAFPHFNSKLLSSATTPESLEMSRQRSSSADKQVRLATSSPDVKALFNNSPSSVNNTSSYMYQLSEQESEETEDSPSAAFPATLLDDYWMPLPSISSGLQVERSRVEDAFKRGSDSLLEKKIKEQIAKPRSLTNRAQSLDLTFHLARITEQSSRLPPPDSPTNSIYGLAEDSDPAPLFPSVYGPPTMVAPPNRISSLSRSSQHSIRSQTPLDDMSHAVSNLHI